MPSGPASFSETNSNGVKYALTYVPGIAPPVTAHYNLKVTDINGNTVSSANNIPVGNVVTAGSTEAFLTVSVVGTSTYVVPPSGTGNFTLLADVLGTTQIYVGGTATIAAAVDVGGSTTINVDGGTATLASGIVADALSGTKINIDNGGTFSNGSGLLTALSGADITYGPNGGTFIANAGGNLLDLSSTTITGFTAGTDNIEFQNLAAPVDSYSITNVGAGATGSQNIELFGANGAELGIVGVGGQSLATGMVHQGQSGPLTFESNTAANITFDPVASVLCFLAGTQILAPHGEVDVATLKAGDQILTADGRTLPVRWIGLNTVSTVFADPVRVMPIRIQAGALGNGLPTRDLLVSPDHAMFIDGVLIQAGALVNGRSITRESNMPSTFTYYHVEVEDHSLILAEGAPTETFVDNVDRMAFDNWAEHEALYGNDVLISEMAYPRAVAARQVPRATRERLSAIACGFAVDLVKAA